VLERAEVRERRRADRERGDVAAFGQLRRIAERSDRPRRVDLLSVVEDAPVVGLVDRVLAGEDRVNDPGIDFGLRADVTAAARVGDSHILN
jgi:hypothetical protein